jgi:hypothetical protein
MTSSRDNASPKRSWHDHLSPIALERSPPPIAPFEQQRKPKNLTIEVNRSVEISHVHHDTVKIHRHPQVFSGAGTPSGSRYTQPAFHQCCPGPRHAGLGY